ncbi:unnamed protein product [Cylindrotheca closterium]|uniref:Uncharacterized protein n=1 Tax=Cylindrotheca closterium TaxID=2856 RepID=A0AAD2FFG6_9STRA|nr:unnamed protein product [Cylindrotheca closterium]
MRIVLTASVLVSLLLQHTDALISQSPISRSSPGIARFAEVSGADIEQDVGTARVQTSGYSVQYRGKVNEIDYCIAPADVSLSRAYDLSNSKDNTIANENTLSLTQALNNASNRAVRRIILAQCWPSEEALNKSLRLAAAAEMQAEDERIASGTTSKCPVPRPILNLLMRRDTATPSSIPNPKGRTNEQYVTDQIKSFDERYGSLPGYRYAEAYLESILSLATTGQESPRVSEVLGSGVYDESYKRVLSVLKSVGVTFEELSGTDRSKISNDLKNQDICLSMLDKLGQTSPKPIKVEEPEPVEANSEQEEVVEEEAPAPKKKKKKIRFRFWMKQEDENDSKKEPEPTNPEEEKPSKESKKADTGVVLLSYEEPTMTRQLNSLSNIVQRALLFGGDQELLILSETLDTNKAPFIERWYPGTEGSSANFDEETRPGVQYLNALISLLRTAYDVGLVTDLEPAVALIPSYSNAYERIMANLVELGSGYIRPMTPTDSTLPKPRTPTEELGRFAVWESRFRGESDGSYPEDLEGSWEVKDEVGGELIGSSTVVFEPQGEVSVAPPLQGLRWRLDPGPTHLDTCTFQVLSEDGTVLQYRGFIDRGARLEARFSKRSIGIRGSVMFQMRDGDIAGTGADYWKDMLPINYRTGTTKFVMNKSID